MFRYIDSHFHTPETFVENTAGLADNAEIRERLFDGFLAELQLQAEGGEALAAAAEGRELNASDADDTDDGTGTDEADDAEAEVEDPVVESEGPVTEEEIARNDALEQILLDVFDGELYQQVFADNLDQVHTQLLRSSALPDTALLRDKGEIVFDARDLYTEIDAAVAANPATAELLLNERPERFGIYAVADRTTTNNAVWWFIENGPSWRSLTFVGAIVSLLAAVVIAERRPSRAIQFGAGVLGLAVVGIVVIYIVRAVVPLLAGGGGRGGPVVAVYAANMSPLVGILVRLSIIGAIVAAVGGIARLIWPDDWVYGHVDDGRGVRSIRRRRGTPEAQPAQVQQPAAAAVPVGYQQAYPPGYAQPYPGQQWAQPYPPQAYPPPGYAQPYPAGPYAQPGAPAAPYATGNPTVPVVPVNAEVTTGESPRVDASLAPEPPPVDGAKATVAEIVSAPEPVEPAATPPASTSDTGSEAPDDPKPADAAQAVPRVVAQTSIVPDAASTNGSAEVASAAPAADEPDDEWASDGDW